MSYQEVPQPIQPPEIRSPRETCTMHEFFVDLGQPQPEVAALRMMADWLAKQSPRQVVSIGVAYLPETEEEPPMLELTLVLGAPVDIG